MTFVPGRDEFARLSSQGAVVPVYREVVADADTPVTALVKLGPDKPAFLLESVTGGETLGRYSFLGVGARMTFRACGREVTVSDAYGETTRETCADPLRRLEQLLAQFRPAPVPGLPRFFGGAVGYVGYEAVMDEQSDRDADQRPAGDVPDLWFLIADEVLIFDHVQRSLKVVVNAVPGVDADAAYDDACRRIDAILGRLSGQAQLTPLSVPDAFDQETPRLRLLEQADRNGVKSRFVEAVTTVRDRIIAGDVFQVVLSRPFAFPLQARPFDVYRMLRWVNPSPYMFYIDFGDVQLIGASPEVLARLEDGIACVRPIAGTRRRGATAADDERLAAELLADDKERAEHAMLVDLALDDLSRVCVPGTVRVSRLMAIEKYSHVMHIVSDVEGRLAPERTAFDLLRATFPAGTVSGAPRRTAMKLIGQLEAAPRGVYSGAVGYVAFSGNMDACIAIRTVVVNRGVATVQAGAGIVADSDPEREFLEIVAKSEALLHTIALANEVRA